MNNNSMMQAACMPTPPQPQGTENQGELQGFNADTADNGYNLRAHYAPKDSKKGYPEPAHTVHASRQDLLDHLDDILAKHEKGEHEKPGKGKKKA